jgi:hypothetical protein
MVHQAVTMLMVAVHSMGEKWWKLQENLRPSALTLTGEFDAKRLDTYGPLMVLLQTPMVLVWCKRCRAAHHEEDSCR